MRGLRPNWPLLLALSMAAVNGQAQTYAPPGYTFSNGFPNMFPGFNSNSVPGGYQNGWQNPFLTMPSPEYQNAPQNSEQGQGLPSPAPPFSQPAPYWMQNPSAGQPPQRYIDEVPTANPNAAVNFSGYAPLAPTPQNGPPKWAPLPGEPPVVILNPRAGIQWSVGPVQGGVQGFVQPTVNTPPKWPTP